MRGVLVLVALIAACSSPAPSGPEPVDAGGADAAADAAVDAVPCGLLTEPALETWANGMPTGTFAVTWTCIDGWCGERPAPAMTGASMVRIIGNQESAAIIWTDATGTTLGFAEGARPTGNCYRVAPDPAECRSFLEVCAGANDMIARVSWQSSLGHVQTWKMTR